MGCKCGQGLRFAFKELDVKEKPFLQLSSCEDAALLANALTITQCACGQIQGCKTSSICTSISDFIQWRNDASFAPNANTGRAVALLLCPDITECPPDSPDCFICEDGALSLNL
jgi:hypothetical protein